MGRHIRQFRISDPSLVPYNQIHQFLISEGYENIVFQNENVYKKGKGFLTGPSFIKIHTPVPGTLNMEVWMKYAILPGCYVGEFDLEGVMGWAVKGPLKRRAAYLEGLLSYYLGAPIFSSMQAPNYAQQQGFAQQTPSPQSNNTAGSSLKFCTKCGAKLVPGSSFCTSCGNKIQ